jgi:hypothetical protein
LGLEEGFIASCQRRTLTFSLGLLPLRILI